MQLFFWIKKKVPVITQLSTRCTQVQGAAQLLNLKFGVFWHAQVKSAPLFWSSISVKKVLPETSDYGRKQTICCFDYFNYLCADILFSSGCTSCRSSSSWCSLLRENKTLREDGDRHPTFSTDSKSTVFGQNITLQTVGMLQLFWGNIQENSNCEIAILSSISFASRATFWNDFGVVTVSANAPGRGSRNKRVFLCCEIGV